MRLSFSSALILLVTIPCLAAPARTAQQLKSLLLDLHRFVSRWSAQSVRSYQTADTRPGRTFAKHYTLAANGRNLLQPHRHEFTGDDGNAVGIRRSPYASFTWRP